MSSLFLSYRDISNKVVFQRRKKIVVDVKNDKYLSDSVKNYFVFNKISDSEVLNYIKTMNPNKSMRSDVSSIRFVKLSSKIISPNLSKLYKNVSNKMCFLSRLNLQR